MHGPRARNEPTTQHEIEYQTSQINITMHDLPGVVGTGVGVVGTVKNRQKILHIREGLLISLFPRLLAMAMATWNSRSDVAVLAS